MKMCMYPCILLFILFISIINFLYFGVQIINSLSVGHKNMSDFLSVHKFMDFLGIKHILGNFTATYLATLVGHVVAPMISENSYTSKVAHKNTTIFYESIFFLMWKWYNKLQDVIRLRILSKKIFFLRIANGRSHSGVLHEFSRSRGAYLNKVLFSHFKCSFF